MPTPTTKRIIAVKVSNANSNDTVTIHNYTQGWKKRVKCNANSEALYSPLNDDNTANENDKIYVFANGRLRGNGSGSIGKGGVEIKFTGTVDVISQAVNL